MVHHRQFTTAFFEVLRDFKYVLFNYDLLLNDKEKDEVTHEFLLDKKEVTPLLNKVKAIDNVKHVKLSSNCLLYTSPSPRDS